MSQRHLPPSSRVPVQLRAGRGLLGLPGDVPPPADVSGRRAGGGAAPHADPAAALPHRLRLDRRRADAPAGCQAQVRLQGGGGGAEGAGRN